ncbi:hypothetical protein Tsubulata_027163 [Turnera subulata]|uniref:Uncharacterized protein n=1 Tax=Turnera subulata TaxID=218843 RepID=A0A9Q0FJF7_9ROSI|nr:hypothetical protein Tsubulata_027163 [Turnera subulata]
MGMCPHGGWERVKRRSWVRAMSPFGYRVLDVRTHGLNPRYGLELTSEEEFISYRVLFLILGVILLCGASSLSKSIVLYYSCAMPIGIILAILVAQACTCCHVLSHSFF